MPESVVRSRTHEWADPSETAKAVRNMSGQEFLAAWMEGELIPPLAATLGFHLVDFGEGRVEIACEPQEFHYNPYGMVHGGLAATLLDTATGCAVHSLLPAGTGFATTGLNVNFMRPITSETGQVRCLGTVTTRGRRVAVAEAQLVDADDRRLAQATSTCLVTAPDARS